MNVDTNVLPTGKLIFQSGVLDLTCVNRSTDDNDTGMQLEMDVYEITCGKNFETVTATQKDLLQVFGQAAGDTDAIGTGTSLDLVTRGVTPWDLPQALSQYRVKIWKKSKYQMSPGGTFTYQMRDPKRHVMDKTTIEDYKGSNHPRITRWLLFIAKPVPGFASGINAVVQYDIGVTRKYMYKVNDSNIDQDAFNP